MYIVPYEAEFECPKGHRYKSRVSAFSEGAVTMCPTCYQEWIAANVPNGKQISQPVQVNEFHSTMD